MRPPLPPFTAETAAQKARGAEDAWNTRDPERVALAYTVDSRWRNRAEIFSGREAIVAFLTRKWRRELDYRLIKEVWAFRDNRIAVRFAYEWHDDSGSWFRSYGNENWEFDEQHQRPADPAGRAQIPLATRPPARRSSLALGTRAVGSFSAHPRGANACGIRLAQWPGIPATVPYEGRALHQKRSTWSSP
jgi:nuclear transport factor 2 (NTF2) superfamily protein